MRQIGAVLLMAAALAGCESGPSRQQLLAALVGRPESDALRALGAPNNVLDANGHRFLAYEDVGVAYASSVPFGPYGYFYGPAAFPVPRTCTTTLEIVSGRVASWTQRGNACG